MPYTGAGSGVRRALEYDPNAVFYNGISDSREITQAANEFVITIPRSGNQAQPESNLVTDQLQSESEQPTDQAFCRTDQPQSKTDQAIDQVRTTKLSKKQQDISNYCSIPRTAKEILERVGVTSHFDNRKKYIYDLVEIGVLERTVPEKPNDPNQKYRRKK